MNLKKLLIVTFFNTLIAPSIKFDDSMDTQSFFYLNKYSKPIMKENITFLKQLYEKNFCNDNIQKIPKIIHQIWAGPNPIPSIYKTWQKTWVDKHPDWKYILWTDKEISTLKLHNEALYNKTTDYREKADLARYEILYNYGGIYIDMDCECLKPFDELLYYNFFVGIVDNYVDPIVNNAIIGSTEKHFILKNIIENIKDIEIKDWRWRSGVFYFSQEFLKLIKISPGINIALPTSYLYTVPYTYNNKESIEKYIKPESFALHYWGNKIGMNKN